MAESGPSAAPPTMTGSSLLGPAQSRTAVPVGFVEASLDSPSFRAGVAHFSDQVEAIERWLDAYVKSSSKAVNDILAVEESIYTCLSRMTPPRVVFDAVIDQDHTVTALQKAADGSREWWAQILSSVRRMERLNVEPIRSFIAGELRIFKESRRMLDQAQRQLDTVLMRYMSQSRTKEPSALREDAFSLYEARKAYLRMSLDFCQLGAQLTFSLDKLLVRVSADLYRELRRARDNMRPSSQATEEMERIRGWSREMEASETMFKRELQLARKEIAQRTLATYKPSQNLDEYGASTVPYLGSRPGLKGKGERQSSTISPEPSQKQGWLLVRILSGRPARPTWVRRWFYCRNGIFGYLIQGPLGVVQGDEIGILLCSAKPAVQEERRFCFEVKTRTQPLLLQAETQTQLMEWLDAFEAAKKRALEANLGQHMAISSSKTDPAFSITPVTIPEFSARALEGLNEDSAPSPYLDRAGTLPIPPSDGAARPSVEAAGTGAAPSSSRRVVTGLEFDSVNHSSSREHAARLIQKFDIHRKSPQVAGIDATSIAAAAAAGSIANLATTSQTFLPSHGGYAAGVTGSPESLHRQHGGPSSSQDRPRPLRALAPATLAKPPFATSLSKAAVTASAELGSSRAVEPMRSVPTAAVRANYWGSTTATTTTPGRPAVDSLTSPQLPALRDAPQATNSSSSSSNSAHALSPPSYPPDLRTQHAQFRLLFPHAPRDEGVVLIFNSAWSSSSALDSANSGFLRGSGRIYVTPDHMYFYGHFLGLVVAYSLSLDIISEVTAAPGRDCDYIFLHLGQNSANDTGLSRITVKTFLDDLNLLHARLNLLIDDLQSEEPMDLPRIIKALADLEVDDDGRRSPSAESWEEVPSSMPTDNNGAVTSGRPAAGRRKNHGHYAEHRYRLPRDIHPTKVRLPTHAVVYEPEGMGVAVAERHFELSSKACFHVVFGDNSFIFPRLYYDHGAKEVTQGPWAPADADGSDGRGGPMQRHFSFKVRYVDMLGRERPGDVADYQTIDVLDDHAKYVVTYRMTPWYLPHSQSFKLVCKVIITHVAKSKCRLAIYTKVDWSKVAPPAFARSLVQRQALNDVVGLAEEVAETVTEQVRKLGPHSRTKRAIQVFGQVGQLTQAVVLTLSQLEAIRKTSTSTTMTTSQIERRTLTALIYETLWSVTESAITSVMMWAFAGAKRLFHILTAHRIILALLAASSLYSLTLTMQRTSVAWQERRAVSYMNRMGVEPNSMMSRAIYLIDLEEAAQPQPTGMVMPRGGSSQCRDVFQKIVNMTSMDTPANEAEPAFSSATSRARAHRLRQTRQKLGANRHDLVVALRVVNSIEREIMQTEWENWLAEENARCERVGQVLWAREEKQKKEGATEGGGGEGDHSLDGDGLSGNGSGRMDESRREALRRWHQEYCGSCVTDRAAVMAERKQKLLGGL